MRSDLMRSAAGLVPLALLLSLAACGRGQPPPPPPPPPKPDVILIEPVLPERPPRPELTPLFRDIEKRTFQFFWDTTNQKNGLTPDRYPSRPFSSIASVGFALTAYPIGIENGWVSRTQAVDRTLTTLRFLRDVPTGPQRTGKAGYKGFVGQEFVPKRDPIASLEQAIRICDV